MTAVYCCSLWSIYLIKARHDYCSQRLTFWEIPTRWSEVALRNSVGAYPNSFLREDPNFIIEKADP